MNPTAENAITTMLNAFPQTRQDPELLLATLFQLCASMTTGAITKAAERFACGEVQNQSMRFAPSGPEFMAEVRACEEMLSSQARTRLPRPEYIRGALAPYEVLRQQAWTRYQGWEILFEDVSHSRWLDMSKTGKLPVGAIWVAALGVVFGPQEIRAVQ